MRFQIGEGPIGGLLRALWKSHEGWLTALNCADLGDCCSASRGAAAGRAGGRGRSRRGRGTTETRGRSSWRWGYTASPPIHCEHTELFQINRNGQHPPRAGLELGSTKLEHCHQSSLGNWCFRDMFCEAASENEWNYRRQCFLNSFWITIKPSLYSA